MPTQEQWHCLECISHRQRDRPFSSILVAFYCGLILPHRFLQTWCKPPQAALEAAQQAQQELHAAAAAQGERAAAAEAAAEAAQQRAQQLDTELAAAVNRLRSKPRHARH